MSITLPSLAPTPIELERAEAKYDQRARALERAFARWAPSNIPPKAREDVRQLALIYFEIIKQFRKRLLAAALAYVTARKFAEVDEEWDAVMASAVPHAPNGGVDLAAMIGYDFPHSLAKYYDVVASLNGGFLDQVYAGMADTMKATIGKGAKEGLSREQLMEELLKATGGLLTEDKARLIAQTEAIRTFNAMTYMESKKAHYQYIKWLDGQGGACDACRRLHEQVIPLEHNGKQTYFFDTIRGFAVAHPPLHPGCRCSISGALQEDFDEQPNKDDVAIITQDEVGAYINNVALSHTGAYFNPALVAKSKAYTIDDELFAAALYGGLDSVGVQNLMAKYNVKGSVDDFIAKLKSTYGATSDNFNDLTQAVLKNGKAPDITGALDPDTTKKIVYAVKEVIENHGLPFVNKILFYGDYQFSYIDLYAFDSKYGIAKTFNALKKKSPEEFLIEAEGGPKKPSKSKTTKSKTLTPDDDTPPSAVIKQAAKIKIPAAETLGLNLRGERDAYLDIDDATVARLQRTGSQLGSNEGGVYTDPQTGKKYYVKFYQDMVQAEAEMAAQRINAIAGMEVVRQKVVTINSRQALISEWKEGLQQLSPEEWKKVFKENPALAVKVHFTAALTNNWDVVGLSYDNLLYNPKTKNAVVIDTGGSFTYRAQGAKKPYEKEASAFSTLMDPSINRQAASLFAELYSDRQNAATLKTMANFFAKNAEEIFNRTSLYKVIPDHGVFAARAENIKRYAHTHLTMGALPENLPESVKKKIKDIPPWANPEDYALIVAKAPRTMPLDVDLGQHKKVSFNFANSKDGWGDSSEQLPARIAKANVYAYLYDMDPVEAYVETRLHREDRPDLITKKLMDTWREEYKLGVQATGLTVEATLAIWAENQQILRRMYPDGYIPVLYRGTGSGRTRVADLFKAFKEDGIGAWAQDSLMSYTTNKSKANGFTSGKDDGIVVTLEKIPIEMIFATDSWLAANGNAYTEYEQVFVFGENPINLRPENVEDMTRRYGEPRRKPVAYVVEWIPDPDDAEKWHAWIHEPPEEPEDWTEEWR